MNDLYIIVVFFNPTPAQVAQAEKLSVNNNVIIVDNSNHIIHNLDKLNLMYIPLLSNKGIAYAQNVGIIEAFKKGAKYILFQDQDSQLEQKQIIALFNEYKNIYKYDSKIGAIGPVILNSINATEYKSFLKDNTSGVVSSIISSGMLTSRAALDEIGLMDEKLFIDNVDHEWCWRAKSKGYNIYMTRKSLLCHTIGMKTRYVLGYQIIKSAPIRSFYKFRNNIWLLKRSYVPLQWKIKNFINMLIMLLIYSVCYKEYGKSYISNALKGVKAGLIS